MNALKKSQPFLLSLIALFCFLSFTTAQEAVPGKEPELENLLDSQRYVFLAQSANPLRGRQIFLTSEYGVHISKDTIQSNLPYFGRAFSAPLNPSEGGINFTSTDFEYKVDTRKKGGWIVFIQPKDIKDAHQFNITVFENGKATLQAASNNRQPISFNGYITGVPAK